MRVAVCAFLLVGLVACGGETLPASAPTGDGPGADRSGLRGALVEGAPPAPEIALVDQHGQPFSMTDQRGSLVLLFFGFVHCPDVCPATLSTWSRVLAALGEDARRVRCVFVTVDPARDDAERLAGHLAIYGDDFTGLGGSEQELQPVYEAYDVFREEVRFASHPDSYVVDHTTTMLLIDPKGRQRVRHEFDAPLEDIVHDCRMLLR